MAWMSSQAPFSPPIHNVQDEKVGEKSGSMPVCVLVAGGSEIGMSHVMYGKV